MKTSPTETRVLVLHTGGTIGMAASPDGYRPLAGFGGALPGLLGERVLAGLPAFDVVELEHLIDSSNLQPAHWSEIGHELVRRWGQYDGFVVLHGTDTMAYSASALSFMLRGTGKPVIFTGAQIPLLEPRSDGVDNLVTALILAAGQALPEVCLYFAGRLLRGNRSSKLHTTAFAAFDSPNYPHLADIGIDITLHRERLLPATVEDFAVPVFDPEAVAMVTVYPGIPARIIDAVLDRPAVRGLILRTYGVGNPPDADARLMDALARAVARGVVVLNLTQCRGGSVHQGAYATGATLNRIGVTPGHDLTLEAAFAKLHFLLARHDDADSVRNALGVALCGELG